MTTKWIFIIFFIPFFGLTSGPGEDGFPPDEAHFHRGKQFFFGYHIIRDGRLELSQAQINSIAGINIKYKKNFEEYHNKIQPLKNELRPLIEKEKKTTTDYSRIHVLLKKISAYEVEIRMMKIRHRDEIFSQFTEEQKNQWRINHVHRGKHGKDPF